MIPKTDLGTLDSFSIAHGTVAAKLTHMAWPCPFASVVQEETCEPQTGTKARGPACSRSFRAFLDGFSVAQWRSAYGFGADYARLVLLCDEETKTQGRRRRN